MTRFSSSHQPVSHAGRGKELENAVLSSCETYRRQGIAWVVRQHVPSGQRRDGSFFRARSTMDFAGVVQGVAVAFDCKETRINRFPKDSVHDHQVDELRYARAAGGCAFLLVSFISRATFAAALPWYEARMQNRASIPLSQFMQGDAAGEQCVKIRPGSVACDFAAAVMELQRRAGR